MQRHHLSALTGLRFAAALAVMLFHTSQPLLRRLGAPQALISLVENGFLGVNFFFILSGFVLVYSYTRANGAMRGTRRGFWWARFARVYPLYLLALALALPYSYERLAEGGAFAPFLLQAWVPFGALDWNAPGWSLSAEVFFYAVFPFLLTPLLRARAGALIVVLAFLWVISLLPAILYVLYAPDGIGAVATWRTGTNWIHFVKFNPLLRLPEFVVGMVLGRLFLLRGGALPRLLTGPLVWLLSACAIAVMVLADVPYILLHNGLLDPLMALIVLSCATGAGHLAVWASHRPLVLLGEASYALYLLHLPVWNYLLELLDRLGPLTAIRANSPGFYIAYLVLSLALSVAAYRLFEGPARRALRGMYEGWQTGQAVSKA